MDVSGLSSSQCTKWAVLRKAFCQTLHSLPSWYIICCAARFESSSENQLTTSSVVTLDPRGKWIGPWLHGRRQCCSSKKATTSEVGLWCRRDQASICSQESRSTDQMLSPSVDMSAFSDHRVWGPYARQCSNPTCWTLPQESGQGRKLLGLTQESPGRNRWKSTRSPWSSWKQPTRKGSKHTWNTSRTCTIGLVPYACVCTSVAYFLLKTCMPNVTFNCPYRPCMDEPVTWSEQVLME